MYYKSRLAVCIVLSMLAFFSFSCKKDPIVNPPVKEKLELSTSEITASLNGVDTSFMVFTTGEWSAKSNAEWCVVSNESGTGDSKINLSILANDLQLDNSRTADITVANANDTLTLRVMQLSNESSRFTDSLVLHELFSLIPFPAPNEAWDPAKPITTWKGVNVQEVNGKFRVIGFSMTAAIDPWDGRVLAVDTRLPESIGNLSELKSLTLNYAGFSGPIPASIGKLKHLQTFKANESGFQGAIPSEISHLKNLKELSLSVNSFDTDIPAEIFELSKLEYLDLSYNHFKNIPDSFDKLPNLKYLAIGNLVDSMMINGEVIMNHPIDRKFPQSILKLDKLADLYMDYSNFIDVIPSEINQLVALERFSAAKNSFSNEIPSTLFKCSNLKAVNLSNNKLTGSIPANIGDAAQLVNIDISFNQISGSIPASIGNCKLTNFSAFDNLLSGSIPDEMFNNTQLSYFDISYNQIEGIIPQSISNCKQLVSLRAQNNLITEFPAEGIQRLGNLAEIFLGSNNISRLPETADLLRLKPCTFLDLSNNNIEGTIPAYLGDIIFLNGLYLYGNRFSGEIPPTLLNHENASMFLFAVNICPQQPGFLLTNCPDDLPKPPVDGGEGGLDDIMPGL